MQLNYKFVNLLTKSIVKSALYYIYGNYLFTAYHHFSSTGVKVIFVNSDYGIQLKYVLSQHFFQKDIESYCIKLLLS